MRGRAAILAALVGIVALLVADRLTGREGGSPDGVAQAQRLKTAATSGRTDPRRTAPNRETRQTRRGARAVDAPAARARARSSQREAAPAIPNSGPAERPRLRSEHLHGGHVPRSLAAPARRAARRFLPGYLAFSYGRTRKPRIGNAGTRELRRQLLQSPPRVPADVRARRARVVSVTANSAAGRTVAVVARIDDGVQRYDVTLAVTRTAPRRWRVTSVGL